MREYLNISLYVCRLDFQERNNEIPGNDPRQEAWLDFAHIAALKGGNLRALNVLRVISSINFGPDRKTLLRLYWAIGKSKIDYAGGIQIKSIMQVEYR